MVTTLILLIPLSFLSAVFGRAGGEGNSPTDLPTWIPMWLRQRWVRPLGCSVCCLLPLAILHPSWWLIPALGASYGALSTYWDWLFGGKDNFWFSGFVVGLSALFLLSLIPWWIILIRAFVIAIAWGVLNIVINKGKYKDGTEELWRYGLLGLTTVILL